MKKWIVFCLVLALTASMCVPALASSGQLPLEAAEAVRTETCELDGDGMMTVTVTRQHDRYGVNWLVSVEEAGLAAAAFVYLAGLARQEDAYDHAVIVYSGERSVFYAGGVYGGDGLAGQVPEWVAEAYYGVDEEEAGAFLAPIQSLAQELFGPAEEEPEPEDDDPYGLGVASYEPGQYKVGADLPEGEYLLLATNSSGYFSVSSDANGADILFNDVFETNSIATVRAGEYLKLSRCIAIPWEAWSEQYTINLDNHNTGVMLKVGHDLPAGEYKLVCESGKSGYYAIYDDSRHDDIVANDIFDNSTYVTVARGQYLKLSRCYVEQ